MATSSSTNYNQTRDEIISDSLQLIGVLGAGETAKAADLTFCSSILNKMIKAWEGRGIHLWKESEAVIALVVGQNKYTLVNSGSGTDAGDNPIETILNAAASGSTLTLVSTTGMTALDNISIELDDGTRHVTTIVSVDSSTSVTITDTLPSVASSGNTVFSYTTKLDRPIHISSIRYKYKGGIERKMKVQGRSAFMQLPNKENQGPATCYYYSPQLNNGLLYIWPSPSSVGDYLKVSYVKSIQDFDSGSNDPDFPQEWLECITYNLCIRIAPAYGKALSKESPDLVALAVNSLRDMESWDFEEGSIQIAPNNRSDGY